MRHFDLTWTEAKSLRRWEIVAMQDAIRDQQRAKEMRERLS